jgi:hypothetical protein
MVLLLCHRGRSRNERLTEIKSKPGLHLWTQIEKVITRSAAKVNDKTRLQMTPYRFQFIHQEFVDVIRGTFMSFSTYGLNRIDALRLISASDIRRGRYLGAPLTHQAW